MSLIPPTAARRGRPTVRHLVAGVLAPVVVALGSLAAVAAPASAAPTGSTPQGSSLTSESFGGSTVTDGAWRALGDGCLTRATTAPAPPASSLGVCGLRLGSPAASASTGYLQLTDATGSRKGGAVYTKASPSAAGLDVTFDQWQYGKASYGGDGLSFFLADGAAGITSPGGLGGALGYAQNTNQPAAPNGIAGAYLGVGLDVHGVYATSQDGHGTGCTTGQSTRFQANSVVLRGPGSGKTGYCYLAASNLPTTQKLHLTVTDPSVVTPTMSRRFRVTVSPDRLPTVTVYAAFTPTAELTQVLRHTMTTPAPATYQFGFAASSGSVSDTHLIGNVAASSVAPLDTTPPVITIAGGASALVTSSTPTVSGTTDNPAGSIMNVVIGTEKLSATVGTGGTWSVTPTALPQGPVSVTASASDTAGNIGTATQTLTIAAPGLAIDGGPKMTTNLVRPTIGGTSTGFAGRTVTVSVAGRTLTSTIGPQGTWSVVPTTLTEGGHQVVARVSSANGLKASATQGLTIDTVAPSVVIDGGSTASTRSASPTISGRVNLPAGSSVRVEVDATARTLELSSTRTWSMTSSNLVVGAHTVVVSATDSAGNVGSRRQRLAVVPSLAIDGGKARLTKDATPTISGTTDAPSGSTVTVSVGDQALLGTVSGSGTWSVRPDKLTSTVHPVLATLRDTYGNGRSARQSLTVDTVAPSIVIDGGAATTTRSSTPTISGRVNVPAGSSIVVAVDGASLDAVVTSARTWSVTTPRLTAGTHAVVVSATDAAGNTGTQKQRLTVKS